MIKNHVIVGLDDSAASRAAYRWAAAYAHTTGKDLRAVHVLDWPIGLSASAFKPGTRLCVPKQEIAEPYRRGIQGVFDDTNPAYGSVLQFAQGDVGDILVRLSTYADLLVVGTREPVRGRHYNSNAERNAMNKHFYPAQTEPPPIRRPQSRARRQGC